jgi:hypothetical protein
MVMIDGSDRVTFDDKVIWVPRLQMLPGTTIARRGDRGRLVLARWLAINLDLI